MSDYSKLKEAAEKALNGERHERCSIVPVPPATALSLLDAIASAEQENKASMVEIANLRADLAASEAKLEKAREALKPFERDLSGYDIEPGDEHRAIHMVVSVGDLRRAATTLKDIT